MSIGTYFSHSYRVQDQALNKAFWSHFKSDFSFFVDPPSDVTIHTHLEAMMRRCSAFVAVFNRRRDIPGVHCSPFMLYEFGLAVQARRPKLLLIDQTIDATPFERLDRDETFYFSPNDPDARLDELREKIDRLKEVARAYPNALDRQRGRIGVVVPRANSACAYAQKNVLARIAEVADRHGFHIGTLPIPHQHNAYLALALDQYEAVILDVRGTDLPDWVFPYAHGRLVPTIKLARLEPGEVLGKIVMPPIVEGLRMDEAEPGVESVMYWRDADDLILQLERAFLKMDEGQTVFKKDDEALLYFESIGRRPANIFISNAGNENPLAGQLSKALRLRNIRQFHYKDADAIPTGSNWPSKIRSEVETCDVFVAIIGKGYENSLWSREELRIARTRDAQIVTLPYAVVGDRPEVPGGIRPGGNAGNAAAGQSERSFEPYPGEDTADPYGGGTRAQQDGPAHHHAGRLARSHYRHDPPPARFFLAEIARTIVGRRHCGQPHGRGRGTAALPRRRRATVRGCGAGRHRSRQPEHVG